MQRLVFFWVAGDGNAIKRAKGKEGGGGGEQEVPLSPFLRARDTVPWNMVLYPLGRVIWVWGLRTRRGTKKGRHEHKMDMGKWTSVVKGFLFWRQQKRTASRIEERSIFFTFLVQGLILGEFLLPKGKYGGYRLSALG